MTQPSVRLQADVSFEARSSDGSAGVSGSVSADGSTIDVTLSGPLVVRRPSRNVVRLAARSLAERGLQVVLHGPEGVVVSLGDVRAPWWQRLMTRSRHIRVGSFRQVRRLISSGGRQSAPAAVVPPTLLPLFPTVSRLGPRPVTTTHDPRGGGRPRLVFALSPWPRAGEVQRVEFLTRARTTIGSGPDCDIQVDGLEPVHAVVERTADDEYVLTHVATSGTSTVAGIPARHSRLRTGSAIALGPTRLTYFRAEYADHGRPYGGRLGGEIDHQRPQPTPRPRESGTAGRPRTNRDPGRYFR
jgi:hypothetical protein